MAKTASRIDRNKICADLTIVISKDISGHFIFFFMKVYYFSYSVITIIRKEIEKYPKKGCLVQKIQCFFSEIKKEKLYSAEWVFTDNTLPNAPGRILQQQ